MPNTQNSASQLDNPVLWCIYDTTAENSSPLFLAKNIALARRTYLAELKQNPYAQDMRMYHLGSYNVRTMQMDLLPSPIEVLFTDLAPIKGI